jgi:hypothetical protein
MAVSTQTNQVYRKEYFVNAQNVLSSSKGADKRPKRVVSSVFDSAAVCMSDQPVVIHGTAQSQIRVDTITEGSRITRIKIACPCGRTTEMKVQYES